MSSAPSVRPLSLPHSFTCHTALLFIKDKYEILIMRGALKVSRKCAGSGVYVCGGHIKYDGAGDGEFVLPEKCKFRRGPNGLN